MNFTKEGLTLTAVAFTIGNAGHAAGGVEEGVVRGGDGGTATPTGRIHATKLYSSDGSTPLIDTNLRGTTMDFTVLSESIAGQYRAQASNSGNQSLSNATTTTINFDSENFDVGSLHNNATNNSRITIPSSGVHISGVWVFTAEIEFFTNGTGARSVVIAKNGVTRMAQSIIGPSATQATRVQCTAFDMSPSAGDYYTVQAYQDSGGSLNVVLGSLFSAMHLF